MLALPQSLNDFTQPLSEKQRPRWRFLSWAASLLEKTARIIWAGCGSVQSQVSRLSSGGFLGAAEDLAPLPEEVRNSDQHATGERDPSSDPKVQGPVRRRAECPVLAPPAPQLQPSPPPAPL